MDETLLLRFWYLLKDNLFLIGEIGLLILMKFEFVFMLMLIDDWFKVALLFEIVVSENAVAGIFDICRLL